MLDGKKLCINTALYISSSGICMRWKEPPDFLASRNGKDSVQTHNAQKNKGDIFVRSFKV